MVQEIIHFFTTAMAHVQSTIALFPEIEMYTIFAQTDASRHCTWKIIAVKW